MGMNRQDETVSGERARARELAHALVEEAWNLGANTLALTVQYEGAIWQVSVRVVETEG